MDEAQAERVRTCKQGHDVAESWHDGTRWHCRGCHRVYSRRWAAKNPDKIKAKTKRGTERKLAKREAERPTPEEEARRKLAARSTRNDVTGCLVWTGRLERGYGRMQYDGRTQYAHRIAWQLARGPIGEGRTIDHLCHHRACIEVDHLREVTPEANSRNRRPGGRLGEVWDKLSPNPYSTTWMG